LVSLAARANEQATFTTPLAPEVWAVALAAAVTWHVSVIVVEPRFVGASAQRIESFVLEGGLLVGLTAVVLVLTPLPAVVEVLVVVGPTEAPPT
jgi:hypothetical protein